MSAGARALLLGVPLGLASAGALAADELYLKPTQFFVRPKHDVRLELLSGSFTSSESAVARDRIADLSVVGPDGRERVDGGAWRASGSKSVLMVRVGSQGTYVIGASVAARERPGSADSARARRSEHVKALVQVGDGTSDHYGVILGYPAEVVPLDNPYGARFIGSIRVRCLVDGEPVEGMTVLAGGQAVSQRAPRGPLQGALAVPDGGRIAELRATTDADGVARFRFTAPGQYFVRFTRTAKVPGDSTAYEARAATLTFEVR